MYMDDIELFAKNKKELKTQIKVERIHSKDIGVEFGKEKCAMLIMISGKWHMIEGIELPNQEKKQNSRRKKKLTNSWNYWKQIPSNMRIWKKKI